MSGEKNRQREQRGRLIGGGITMLFHLVLLFFFFTASFHTIHPFPQDEGILVELMSEEVPNLNPRAIIGHDPRSLDPNPNQEVRLVQQSINIEEVNSQVRSQQNALGEVGDVELYEPDPPKPINQRALFRSRDLGDSLADQGSRIVGSTMQAGALLGNTQVGNPIGTPSAQLQGRSVDGSLPLPEYNANNREGTVIVRIFVDQYGDVNNAIVNQEGTTITNSVLWDSAVKAALKAKFNQSGSAPVVQEGAITYVFRLK